ncbi:hypothetical protein DMENIID0001_124450 [Sergentomyia squamirostris]
MVISDTLEMKLTARDLDHVFFIDKARVPVNGAAERQESENLEGARTKSKNTGLIDIRFATRRFRDSVRSCWSQRNRGEKREVF